MLNNNNKNDDNNSNDDKNKNKNDTNNNSKNEDGRSPERQPLPPPIKILPIQAAGDFRTRSTPTSGSSSERGARSPTRAGCAGGP